MDDMFNYYKQSCVDNLCAEYTALWRACGNDDGKLIRLALRQQAIPHLMHYCYTGKGLSKEYIKEKFKTYINGRRTIQNCDGVEGYTYGIFVDYSGFVGVKYDVSAFMWCEDTTLIVPNTKCPTIYCGCKTNLHIVGNGYNSIRIYAFDESSVTIDDIDENSNVTIFKYSKAVKTEKGDFCMGKVREFDKELRLY